ncbi:MAG: hypothetical protein KGS28_14875 [Betaproteobacteria bacterium]|nr:hypothetical protein [Betaproteobacteria bacterium]
MRTLFIEAGDTEAWLRQAELAAKIAVLAMIAGLLVLGVLSARGLFADGAYFFYRMMQKRGFFDFDEPRLFAQLITQTPVVLAMRAGVRNLDVLARLQSLGLIGIPLAFWFSALLVSSKDGLFWHFCLAFAVSYLSSGFFSIGEYNTAYAISAFAFSILLRKDLGTLSTVSLIAASIVLTRAYESMLFLGPVLFAASIYRARFDSGVPAISRAGLIIAALTFALASGIAGRSILFPRDPANLANAEDLKLILEQKFFVWLAIATSLSGFLLFCRLPRVSPALAFLGAALSTLFVFHLSWENSPSDNYNLRVISGLLLCAIMALTCVTRLRGDGRQSSSNYFGAVAVFCVTFALCVPMVRESLGFARWARNVQSITERIRHNRPIDGTSIDQRGASYDWRWPDPWLSAILKGNSHGIILSDHEYDERDFSLGGSAKVFAEFKSSGPLYRK